MLVITVTTTPDVSCIFRYNGRDIGRGSTISVPINILRSREGEQNRTFLTEAIDVDLVDISRAQTNVELLTKSVASSERKLAELRLPLADIVPIFNNSQLAKSEGRYYKMSATSPADKFTIGKGFIYIEMHLSNCDGVTREALSKIFAPRTQLCEFLPPSMLQYKHLYIDLSNEQISTPASSLMHPKQCFADSLAGCLTYLPGPRVGEVILDRRENVEWRPLVSGNAFGDKFALSCRGSLFITDLRIIFLPHNISSTPWSEGVHVPYTATLDIDETALLSFRKATFQLYVGNVEQCRFQPVSDLSQACVLIFESKDGCSTEFLVKKGIRQQMAQGVGTDSRRDDGRGLAQSAHRALHQLYLSGIDSDKVAPVVWCSRATESVAWLVKEDRQFILWNTYMKMTADEYAHSQKAGSVAERTAWMKKVCQIPSLESEYQRMRVVEGGLWRLYFNDGYALCPSYPQTLCLPSGLDEDETTAAANQRSKGRLGSLVWLHPYTKVPLCRAAQPLSGMSGYATDIDRKACLAIKVACPTGAPLRIADARPRLNANANALQGKGFESISALGGPTMAALVFLDIENIHEMRRSLGRLREGVVPTATTASTGSNGNSSISESESIQSSKWLGHTASLLRASACISESILIGHPVLTHCSDGWDRTSQLSSIAQFLLDPYYRTIEGFFALVHKEWCAYGHHFEDRCNGKSGSKETSPVFLQFLDCVWQIAMQNPSACEFSSHLLHLMAQASSSGVFTTFRCDSERERFLMMRKVITFEELRSLDELQFSTFFCYVNLLLRGPTGALLVNPLYTPPTPAQRLCHYIRPRCGLQDLSLWRAGLAGCWPYSITQSGIEGRTAAESGASALVVSMNIARSLHGCKHGEIHSWMQQRVEVLMAQARVVGGFYLQPALGLRQPLPPRPLPPKPSLAHAHGKHPSLIDAYYWPVENAAGRGSARSSLAMVAGLRILFFMQAVVTSKKALMIASYSSTNCRLRYIILVFALHEIKVAFWARRLVAETTAKFIRDHVLSIIVEDALNQGLRTEHAQGFMDGLSLQTVLLMGEGAGRDERRSTDTIVGALRKLTDHITGGYESRDNSASEKAASPPHLVPSAHGGSSEAPRSQTSTERGTGSSMYRQFMNTVNGKG